MADGPLVGGPLAGPRYRMPDGSAVCETPGFADLIALSESSGLPLRWMVVDDLVETVVDNQPEELCELAISPWPRLTTDGRLFFAESEDDHRVGSHPAGRLWRLARESRARVYGDAPEAAELVGRPLRVGDVFSALVELDEPVQRPVGGEIGFVRFPHGSDGILDITADARVFARVQVALAEAPPLTGDQLKILEDGLDGRRPGETA
jgi:hypothetical protein